MKRAARIDANQPEIVGAFRDAGWMVHVTSQFGGGFPDLVCARLGRVVFVEVKDGSKPESARRLTPEQVVWHEQWRDHASVRVVESVKDVRRIVGLE